MQETEWERSISLEEHTGEGAGLFINKTLNFPPEVP